jgi:sugar phosphate isomerase/epimerase
MFNFSFSSNAFRYFSLTDCIRALSAIGYKGVEIMADAPHAFPPYLEDEDIARIKKELSAHQMGLANINAFTLCALGDAYHPSWIERGSDKRDARINHTLNCIELAAKLGAKTVSTEPGGPLGGIGKEEGLLLFRAGLMEVEYLARERGIKVLIEPEPGLLIEKTSEFLDLFATLPPDIFGINFDIGHFFCMGEDIPCIIKELKPIIYHFHIEDIPATREHVHVMPGEGAINFAPIFEAIFEADYQGYLTVELYTYEDEPLDAARTALARLEKIAEAVLGKRVIHGNTRDSAPIKSKGAE